MMRLCLSRVSVRAVAAVASRSSEILATRSYPALSSFAPACASSLHGAAFPAFQQPSFSFSRRGYGDIPGASFLDKDQVTDRVVTVVKNFQKIEPGKVLPTSHFINDLGLDSLDTVELVMALEDEFAIEIPDAEAEKIASVADAISYIAANPQAK